MMVYVDVWGVNIIHLWQYSDMDVRGEKEVLATNQNGNENLR